MDEQGRKGKGFSKGLRGEGIKGVKLEMRFYSTAVNFLCDMNALLYCQ